MNTEGDKKLTRVRDFLAGEEFDGVLLGKRYNFYWLTGGATNHVVTGTRDGGSFLLVTEDDVYLLASRIEMPRVSGEEDLGLDYYPVEYDWYDPDLVRIVEDLGLEQDRVRSDTSGAGFKLLPRDFGELRYGFTDEEIPRYRSLGEEVTNVVENYCRYEVEPGETEVEVAANLETKIRKIGVESTLILVGSDERMLSYRHPIPKDKSVESYVMIVICAHRGGQFVNMTRTVSFGPVPRGLSERQEVCARVDAAAIAGTTVGRPVSEVLGDMKEVYAENGYAEQWKLHHQGGATGYLEREYVVTPESMQVVKNNQPFAWNPSNEGAKTEDTIIVREGGFEFITEPGEAWPTFGVESEGEVICRPRILEV